MDGKVIAEAGCQHVGRELVLLCDMWSRVSSVSHNEAETHCDAELHSDAQAVMPCTHRAWTSKGFVLVLRLRECSQTVSCCGMVSLVTNIPGCCANAVMVQHCCVL